MVKKFTGWDLRKQNRTKEYLTQLEVSKQTSVSLKKSMQRTNHQSCHHETKSNTAKAVTVKIYHQFIKNYSILVGSIVGFA